MAHHSDAGPFPGCTAIRSVSQADLKKLTYGTSYKAGVPGKVSREEDRWENFIDLHGVGRRDTKYMKFQKMKAPLLDRSACSGARDFVELPIGDNVINAELAKSFKGNTTSGKAGLDVSAKHQTTYMAEHAGYSQQQTKAAKQRSYKPKSSRTSTITGMTDLLETRPSSHVAHSTPEASLAKAAEIVLAKGNINLAGSWGGEPAQTHYKDEFSGKLHKHARSAPTLPEMKSHPALLPEGHESFRVKRVSYMSPGM